VSYVFSAAFPRDVFYYVVLVIFSEPKERPSTGILHLNVLIFIMLSFNSAGLLLSPQSHALSLLIRRTTYRMVILGRMHQAVLQSQTSICQQVN
jgi:hypothetical protein